LFWQAVAQRNNKEIKISSIRRFVAARNASVTLGRHAPHRHVGGGGMRPGMPVGMTGGCATV